MTDANRISTGLAVDGANMYDLRLLADTIENRLLRFQRRRHSPPEHLCLDKGYDFHAIRATVSDEHGFRAPYCL